MRRQLATVLLIVSGIAAAVITSTRGNAAAGVAAAVQAGPPTKIGSQIAGTFADATGHSGQSHLVYAANSGVWYLFTLTSGADSPGGSNHIVKAYRSSGSDLATAVWTAAADSPGAAAATSGSMGGGRALGVVYVNNAPADIIHAEVAMAADGSDGVHSHIRARLTATGITWEAWSNHLEPAATWSTPRAVTLGLSTGKFIHSGGPILQQEIDANARKSSSPDTGAAWSSGFGSVSVIDNSMINSSNAMIFAPLANDTMLAVYDNGGGVSTCYNCGQTGAPEPNLTNLGYKKSNTGGSWPAVPVASQGGGDGQVFSASATIDQNDWTLVPLTTTAIRAYRRSAGGAGIDAAAYNAAANTWSTAAAPPPFGAGQAFKSGAGLFGAHDASTTWLFVVNTDAANSILYSRYDGTSWSSWTAVPGTDSGAHARRFISGAPVVAAGQIGLVWTEGTGPYEVFTTSLPAATDSVPPPLPTVTLSASPASITSGTSSTLTWSSTNATSISIDQGIGTVAASGTRSVSPTATTTYTVTAANASGSATATATVTVTAPPPLVITNPAAGNITQSSARITWTTSAAANSRIDYGPSASYGAFISDGTQLTGHSLSLTGLSPSTTYHYRITSQGTGAPASTADLTFATTAPALAAQLMGPVPGSNLTAGTQMFTWNAGSGVTSYKIDVGTTIGGKDVYAGVAGTGLSAQVTGLPTNGVLLWVRLQSMIGGVWQSADYPYKAYTSAPGMGMRPDRSDFDGDGKTDLALFRPSSGYWYVKLSSTNYATYGAYNWGSSTDIPVPGDYDGDRLVDPALYSPSTGIWSRLLSTTGFATSEMQQWGTPTDIPMPGDYDGDGRNDLAVYRPSTGMWYIELSSSHFTTYVSYQWGASTDVPVPGDYDGDGETDVAVYRPSTGAWLVLQSSTNFTTYLAQTWGLPTDRPVPADYDGDGKTDLGLFRPSTGEWLVRQSGTNYLTFISYQWGNAMDVVVPGDYDGDRRTDFAVYRPSTGFWYAVLSSTNFTSYIAAQWGALTDVPAFKRP